MNQPQQSNQTNNPATRLGGINQGRLGADNRPTVQSNQPRQRYDLASSRHPIDNPSLSIKKIKQSRPTPIIGSNQISTIAPNQPLPASRRANIVKPAPPVRRLERNRLTVPPDLVGNQLQGANRQANSNISRPMVEMIKPTRINPANIARATPYIAPNPKSRASHRRPPNRAL